MKIALWPLNDRPREKLLSQGADALTDAELIAILLRQGIAGKTAVDLARELLLTTSNLTRLMSIDATTFCQTRGLGLTHYATIKAAFALGKRVSQPSLIALTSLNQSALVKSFLLQQLRDKTQEVFACLFLDNRYRLLQFEILFYGTIHEVNVYPREVIKKSLAYNAAKIILAHNHPSGDPEPSQQDINLTRTLQTALNFVDIEIIDHIIVGHADCTSLAERGW